MSKRKLTKVKGTLASYDFRIPNCSVHRTKCVRGTEGEWVCLVCADEWLESRVQHAGASFSDVFPNRAARRAAQRL